MKRNGGKKVSFFSVSILSGFFFPSNEKKQISSSSPADGPVARTCCIPIAHLLFSTTKMHGSLYRLAMLRHS